MTSDLETITTIDPDRIDEQVDALMPFDEPLRSVWEAVSNSIEANDDHIGIAKAALKAALHGTLRCR